MGRTRGGLTTKIHAVVDACGLPIMLKLTEGQAHDGRSAQDMLATLGPGDVLLGERAYDSDALRQDLAARGARADAGPKCLLVPTSSGIEAMNGKGSGLALRNLGEPLGPVLHESAEFESAYRERRWIGDFAWNSPAHADITALATFAKLLLSGKKE